MSKFYAPTLKHHIVDLITSELPKELELSAFTFNDNISVFVGAVCYREFIFKNVKQEQATSYGWLVKTNTLDSRRIKFLEALISWLQWNNQLKAEGKRKMLLAIMHFVSWIGTQTFDVDFNSPTDVKHAYQEFTKWLIYRTKLNDGNKLKLKNNSAAFKQRGGRIACSLMLNCHLEEVKYWAAPIRLTDRDKFEGTLTDSPVTDEDKFSTYAALCDYIHQVWSLWVKKEVEAVIVKGNELFNHIDMHATQRLDALYNKVSVAAIMSFIAASGSNLQIALEASLDNFDYNVSSKNSRLAGIKSRARGKIVYPEFSAKYLNIWKKWLDIRSMWLRSKGISSELAFPYLGTGEELRSFPSGLLDSSRPGAYVFIHNYGVKWISARKWRSFKSKLLGKSSDNDIFASAEMQGHSIKTAIRHYTNRNLADAAQEISAALDAVYVSAVTRCRYKDQIPVTILSTSNPNQNTPIGACTSTTALSPAKTEGFTAHAPQPDCSVKETCLFCDQYAVHADATDIRKLLSFNFLVDELAKTIPHTEWAEKWSPYQHRVNEILTRMSEKRPDVVDIISQLSEEIQCGELDDFWLSYYETLSQLGVVLS